MLRIVMIGFAKLEVNRAIITKHLRSKFITANASEPHNTKLKTNSRKREQIGHSRNVLSFSVGDVFAIAKVMLLRSEVCVRHK